MGEVMNFDEYKEEYKNVVAVCEANSYEMLCLWKENHERVVWQEESQGRSIIVGGVTIEGERFPVVMCIFCAKLNGKRILFFEATSLVVHHDMVKDAIREIVPDRPIRDAMNFHNVLRDAGVKRSEE